MLRLALKLAAAAAALWAIWSFVPLHGRTLAERWAAAGSGSAFVEQAWAEVRGVPADERAGAAQAGTGKRARPPARSRVARAGAPGARDRTPTEAHTDADRRAVDRLVSEHLDESR